MNRFSSTLLISALALAAGTALAAPTTSDEARALAAQATAAQVRADLFRAPQPEAVALGDYRADAHNASRVAAQVAKLRAVQAYGAGVRSTPLAVNSEDSARAEAQRVNAEQAIAQQHALALRSAQAGNVATTLQ